MKTSVEELFDVLLDQPAWAVRHTHGSCFFMEFGNPHRVVREPLPVRDGIPPEQIAQRRRRRIFFRGDWSLLIYACNWSLQAWELSASSDSTPSEMAIPFEAVDGQYLTTVHYDALTKTTTLMFDLGAQLRLWPNEDLDDHEPQWSLCSIDKAYSSFILSGDIDIAAGDDV
ncbi:hypothetical protein [Paraburkholderia nemoris]|uniref:hypothetical protein n=1 Tax=Paraburkholderia nemoris TaxID=2793076 RepID=UPI001B8D1A1A|nr:hypothetical protein [Paraburkholderia nemoris]